MMSFRWLPLLLLVALMLNAVGCGGGKGPKLARVRGVITFAGKPLADATVQFIPEDGRPSLGITDKSGRYDLGYASSLQGAVLGKHRVRISTLRPATEATKAAPETVPAKYNVRSELTREVVAGKNEFNFDLDANGPIVQPSPDD